jgi:hypothetical protein
MRDQLQDGGDAMPKAVAWLEIFVDTLADAAGDLLAQYPETTMEHFSHLLAAFERRMLWIPDLRDADDRPRKGQR